MKLYVGTWLYSIKLLLVFASKVNGTEPQDTHANFTVIACGVIKVTHAGSMQLREAKMQMKTKGRVLHELFVLSIFHRFEVISDWGELNIHSRYITSRVICWKSPFSLPTSHMKILS